MLFLFQSESLFCIATEKKMENKVEQTKASNINSNLFALRWAVDSVFFYGFTECEDNKCRQMDELSQESSDDCEHERFICLHSAVIIL